MLREKLANYNIILASGSPRRQDFFKQLDVPFTIELKEIEEDEREAKEAEEARKKKEED